ncbi:hypothetical protein VAJ14_23500 [Klebsiella quasipneumoniae]
MNDIAVKMNMSTWAVSAELDELHSVKLPCILHWRRPVAALQNRASRQNASLKRHDNV